MEDGLRKYDEGGVSKRCSLFKTTDKKVRVEYI